MENKYLLQYIKELHFTILSAIRKQQEECDIEYNTQISHSSHGDISYNIDIVSERIIADFFHKNPLSQSVIVIAEGLGKVVYPIGKNELDAKYRIIIDPIDGTREIMYDKRSAWILTGIALNNGESTGIDDIFLSIQTELPTLKQDTFSFMWAEKSAGVFEEWININTKKVIKSNKIHTTNASRLKNGFMVFTNYFPGSRVIVSEIADKIAFLCEGKIKDGTALIFDDQYISTGGQIYLLSTGKYRVVVDIRPLLREYQSIKGEGLPLCAHPYDLCTVLIFQEAGGIITNLDGERFNYPLDTETNCGFIAYANNEIKELCEKFILNEIKKLHLD